MKKIFYLLTMIAWMVACQKEETISMQTITDGSYRASIESHTTARSYMGSDFQFYWHNGDRISIYTPSGRQIYEYNDETGTTKGEFVVADGGWADTTTYASVTAAYPSDLFVLLNSNAATSEMITEENAIISYSADCREWDVAAGELIGCGKNPMVAVTGESSRTLSFQNLCGYLMLQLYGDNIEISSIRITENNPTGQHGFSGKFRLTAMASGEPTLTPLTAEELDSLGVYNGYSTYAVNDVVRTLGTSAEEATPVVFALPPRILAHGFSVTVQTTDGQIFEKTTTKEVHIKRNKILPMSPIKVAPAEKHWLVSTPENIALSSEAENFSFSISCENDHASPCTPSYGAVVVEGADWLTLSSQDGTTFTYSATANTSGQTRTGAILIYDVNGYSTHTIGIAQSGLTASEYASFSIIGTWRNTGFRNVEMVVGSQFIEEETFGEDYVSIWTFRADGTGVENYTEAGYSGSDEFTYDYEKGILTLHYSESWGSEVEVWDEQYVIEACSDDGYTSFLYNSVSASLQTNSIDEYYKGWNYFTRYNE